MIIIQGTSRFWEFQDFMDEKGLIDTKDWNYWCSVEYNTYKVELLTQRASDLEAYILLKFG